MTKKEFLGELSGWNSYKPLLWRILEATKGNIYEFGMGPASTHSLHKYATEKKRNLTSFEYDAEWFKKFSDLKNDYHKLIQVDDWDNVHPLEAPEVVFIDHSPGERRWEDIEKIANTAKFVLVHDTEEQGYHLDKVWPLFKYRTTDKTFNTWATLCSNFVNVEEEFSACEKHLTPYRDASGQILPWYVSEALEWLENNIKGRTVFEYGGGFSSYWFHNKAKNNYGVDSNPQWTGFTGFPLGESEKDYVNSIDKIKEPIDVIVVDGIYRKECLIKAKEKLAKGGFIVYDNYQQPEVEEADVDPDEIMKGWKVQVFKDKDHATWKTAVFSK